MTEDSARRLISATFTRAESEHLFSNPEFKDALARIDEKANIKELNTLGSQMLRQNNSQRSQAI
jgi:hypothetical protein